MQRPFETRGTFGIAQWGGYVREYIENALNGKAGKKTLHKMIQQDDIIGSILYVFEILARKSIPSYVPRDNLEGADREQSQWYADRLEEMRGDMSDTWSEFISSSVLSLGFGFSTHEMVFKQRLGQQELSLLSSKYNDGLIGVRGLEERPQWTIEKWLFDAHNRAYALVQSAPPNFRYKTIPLDKVLHVKFRNRNNNPEGYSNLSNAYKTQYYKDFAESIEMIALERDAKGMPIMEVPPDIINNEANAAELAAWRTMLAAASKDSTKWLIVPSSVTSEGTPSQYKLTFQGRGSDRPTDYEGPIKRMEWRLLMLFLSL